MSEKAQPLTVRIPRKLHRQVRHKTIDCNKSLNAIVVEYLERWVTEQKVTPNQQEKA